MSLKEEELQKAKDVATKFESELKEVTLKHTSVNNQINKKNVTNTKYALILLDLTLDLAIF